MPPVLQGQTWIRLSDACASMGLLWRRASLMRAAPRGFSARSATLFLRMKLPGAGFGSARACAPGLPESASVGTGAKELGGPSGFGDSTALERSRPKNSPGRYWVDRSSAAAGRPAHANRPAQTAAAKMLLP